MTRYLVLTSDAETLCGVEAFTRNLAEHLGGSAQMAPLSFDLPTFRQRLRDCDCIVFNFPIVAWKKRLLEPMLAATLAKLWGKKVAVVLHEWTNLDWKRRLIIWPVVRVADQLLFSAPQIEREWRDSAVSRGLKQQTAVIPIPPNVVPGNSDGPAEARAAIRSLRKPGRIIIGQFGSIYPKKNCAELLSIARVLIDTGHDVGVAFVGSFIKGMDDVEQDFYREVEARGLDGRVVVTGYLATDEEVFAACREIDVFCYRFIEGLTARRGSVLAAALTGRAVVVNAPKDELALAHHSLFTSLIENGNVVLAPYHADPTAMAGAVKTAAAKRPPQVEVEKEIRRLWHTIIETLGKMQQR